MPAASPGTVGRRNAGPPQAPDHLPRILTFADYYLPGYRAGGPVRTLANMTDQLGREFSFLVVTRDRDLGEDRPYAGIEPGRWQRVGNADVLYLPPDGLGLRGVRGVIRATEHDVLYLNSFFSPSFTILPLLLRRLRLVASRPLVVAPRGEFSNGALALKAGRKRAYAGAARALRLYRDAIWQASSDLEAADVRKRFGSDARVVIAPDLPAPAHAETGPARRDRSAGGPLRLLFLSRVAPMKNLDGAIRMLDAVRGPVEFNIYGPIEDRGYWSRCQEAAACLPPCVRVHYRGSVPPSGVSEVMAEHDLFFLPTLGENFGHVILEALAAGCPVLISDRTRWRGLAEQGVGWDLPLEEPHRFREVLQQCAEMDAHVLRQLSKRAAAYGRLCSQDTVVLDQNRTLFGVAAGR
jgi:glycosyltransferase involved in cell wall biosynthesis